MTAAATHSSDRTGHQQQWRRTVFVRQGRFFVISVTVRSKCDLPLRTAFSRTYTAGRFTVREEIQWLSQVAPSKAKNQSSVPIHVVYRRQHICSSWKSTDTAVGGAPSGGQQQQQQCNEHLSDAQTTQAQQEELKQQQPQERQAHSLQTAPPAHVSKSESSWWKWLLSARSTAGFRATPKPSTVGTAAIGPVEDERASVSCLQLGSSWGSSLCKTLGSIACTLKRAAGLKAAATSSSGPHQGVSGTQEDATAAAASAAAVTGDASGASGAGASTKAGPAGAKPGAVLVTVLGYSWGGEVLSMDAPA